MGTFRFVLAFAVLLAHIATSIGPSIVNRESLHVLAWSGDAVIAFFIISGFYMSLIINEKYAKLPNGTPRFYLNRALRLYPIHWVILALYAALFALSGTPSFLIGNANVPFWTWLYAMVSNLFFFGVEALPFLDEANWKFVVGPIWSLSIEFYFYLLAPFIVGRSLRTLLVLSCIALIFRLTLYLSGVPMLPWRYFFFPANLVFFLMGSLSYRLYVWLQGKSIARWLGVGAAGLLLVWLVSPPLWTAPDLDQPLSWCFYICVWVCTPLLFNLTRTWKFDNLVGQLSYPIYLSHVLVVDVVKRVDVFHIDKGVVATVLTLALSAGLYVFVDRPIEHIRRRIGAS
jgi:peptidoglycan/LPS O-acetylase OafA/YrhL